MAYSGHHIVHADQGDITRDVPAIVAPELQQKALMRLEENKTKRAEREADRKYLLRGLVRCEVCGRNFAGSSSTARGRRYHYYCAAREGRAATIHNCPRVSAPWLEETVWEDVRRFAQNPGEVLEQLTAQIERENAASDLEERRADLIARLEEAEQEKARVLTAFKKACSMRPISR